MTKPVSSAIRPTFDSGAVQQVAIPVERVRVGQHELTVCDIQSDDLPAVVGLHTLVFGSQVDSSWFGWKYGQDSHQGRGQAVGAWCGDVLVAFCGGVPRTLDVHGQTSRALQLADVMVHPMWRGILTRKGPFYYASSRFYRSRLGEVATHPFQLAFGFGSQIHVRLAVKVGLGWDSGQMQMLHWQPLAAAPNMLGWAWRWEEVEYTDARLAHHVNCAWSVMRAQCQTMTLGHRDIDYVKWRYIDRPFDAGGGARTQYRFFVLRRPWSRNAVGVAVMDSRADTVQWLDWIGPVDLMPLVARAVRCEAGRVGATDVSAWASPAVEACLAHTDVARREVCAWLGMPQASAISPAAIPGLNWWLMGGDTDYL